MSAHVRGSIRHNCIVCGGDFTVAPSKVARGGGSTCSAECRNKVRGFAYLVQPHLPATVKKAASSSNLPVETVRDILGRWVRMGVCHVVGFEENTTKGQGATAFMPVIAMGPPVDPEMPMTMRAAATYYARQQILGAMPGTQQEIASKIRIHETSVSRLVGKIRDDGLSHVGGWKRARGKKIGLAIHHAGPGVDAPCKLKRQTAKQKHARYKRKMKNDPTPAYEKRVKIHRNRYWAEKATKGDELVNALFGPRKPSPSTENQP